MKPKQACAGLTAIAVAVFFLLARLTAVSAAVQAPLLIYVSTTGSDSNNGALSTPFRTLGRARKAIRDAQPLSTSATVYIRAGTYRLSDENPTYNSDGFLKLDTANDSGTSAHPITWAAYPGETVWISGAKPLPAFSTDGTSQVNYSQGWVAPLDSNWPTFTSRDMYNDDRRLRPARYPNVGWCNISFIPALPNLPTSATVACPSPTPGSGSSTNSPLAEIVARRRFVSPRQRMSSWTDTSGSVAISFAGTFGATYNCDANAWPGTPPNIVLQGRTGGYAGDQVYLENSVAWLDVAYEWAFDASTNPASVRMRLPVVNGNSISPGTVVAPVYDRLLVLQNVDYISIIGINFEHTTRPTLPADGYYIAQTGGWSSAYETTHVNWGNMLLTGAVQLSGTTKCTISGCKVAHVGGSGITIETAPFYPSEQCSSTGCCAPNSTHPTSDSNAILGTDVFDCGGNGIWVGPTIFPANGTTVSCAACGSSSAWGWVQNATISGCYVHDFGLTFHDTVGIFVWRASAIIIDSNEIAYGPMSGIQIGRQNNDTHEVFLISPTVTDNNIHHVVQVLSDGAGIYAEGQATTGGGATIAYNWIHDNEIDPTFSTAAVDYAPGLYFDNYSGGWWIYRNVVTKIIKPVIVNTGNVALNPANTAGLCSTSTSSYGIYPRVNYFDLQHLPDSSSCLFGSWFRFYAITIDDHDVLNEASWITVPGRRLGR